MATEVHSPNEIKIDQEEKIDEATGRLIKIVRKIALRKIHTTVSKSVSDRLQWKKFGNAATHPAGPQLSTTTIGEEVFLKLTRDRNLGGDKGSEKKKVESRLTCRGCGGEHWTSKCPFKSLVGVSSESEKASSMDSESAMPGRYIPPSMRYGNRGTQQSPEDAPTVRITNLSQVTTEKDLYLLLNNVGNITRMFLAKDFDTGFCKGYAFVTFSCKEEAQRAIDTLNGHGFANLIIKCEIAKERTNQ